MIIYIILLYDRVQGFKAFKCSKCPKAYSRCDRLNEHLRKVHNTEPTNRRRRFECPFKCGKQPWRTMVELLSHCEKEHQENLGKFIHMQ